MKHTLTLLTALLLAPLAALHAAESVPGRWPTERAQQWYQKQPWPCGFNYVPANAISYTEMWMDYNFDPQLIDQELALAQGVGFNCLRVVLPFVVWEKEPAAFKKRLNTFLDICQRRGLKVMFALFDDCVFGPIQDPVCGKQPDVLPGWYANGWTPSPGHSMVRDASTWPRLENYVKDLLATFGQDQRVWVWDLYNEPTSGDMGDPSIPLVAKVIEWARMANPTQPLTVCLWNRNQRLNELVLENSDIITFHNYLPPAKLRSQITDLLKQGRPLICTEWLNRGMNSMVAESLPIFREYQVGAIHWGLVNGKTQTHLNWGHRPGQPEPKVWQHDIFHSDHTPYDSREIELFKKFIHRDQKPGKATTVPSSNAKPESDLSSRPQLPAKLEPVDMVKRVVELKNLRWGMFICWSFSTFAGKEYNPGIKDIALFNPTGCDTEQWVKTAKDAGMGYILFLTKHHDGFCLWDTQTTDRKVTKSPLGRDVLAELRKSCDRYGIKLALYFSEGEYKDNKDYHPGGYTPEMKKAQLKELLTRYGPIEYIWFDAHVGDGGLSHQKTVEWCHQCQPATLIGFPEGQPAGEVSLRETGRPGPLGDQAAASYNKHNEAAFKGYLLAEFTYPILPKHKGGAKWFYSLPEHDQLCLPAEKLYADYLGAVKYGNIFEINVGPDYNGKLRAIDVATLHQVGEMIRNSSGTAVLPPHVMSAGKNQSGE